jgi:integrase
LKWSDVDFGAGIINLDSAVVHQHVGGLKTEASQKPVPMDGALATALRDWSTHSPYGQPEDWVFASPKMNGTQPYCPETLLKCSVLPAAKRLGIASKSAGIHSGGRLQRF